MDMQIGTRREPYTGPVNPEEIEKLIKQLGDKDGIIRVKARNSLVSIGARVVPALIIAMGDKRESTRWEAAKALGEIASPEATGALVDALRDKEFDLRWLAAEALIAIGKSAIGPVLEVLEKNPDSQWIKEGAHHFLHGMINKGQFFEELRPVLVALEDTYDAFKLPYAAHSALVSLKAHEG
jgi:HEAT repeat protein